MVWSIKLKEYIEIPLSISFDSISEDKFSEVYDSVKNTIFDLLQGRISEKDFLHNLIDF